MQTETMPGPDIAGQWKTFGPERRARLLAKMTSEQKASLRQAIEGRSDELPQGVRVVGHNSAGQPIYGPEEQPTKASLYWQALTNPVGAGGRKQGVGGGILQIGGQAVNALAQPFIHPLDTLAGTAKAAGYMGGEGMGVHMPEEWNPVTPMVAKFIADKAQGGTALALENAAGMGLGMYEGGRMMGELPAKGAKGLAAVRRMAAARYAPRAVPLAGVDVPLTVGEAAPTSGPGRLAIRLKRSGVSGEKFERLEREQLEAVKQVIRRTAQETSGLIGPMQNEPGAAMEDAAEATFRRARPMWKALDSSLVTIPDRLDMVSKLTQQAISQAQKLGVDITDPEVTGEYYVDHAGNPIDRASMSPARFEDAVNRGEIATAKLVEGQPISVYMKVRSRLLKLQRATGDPAARHAIGEQLRAMNANIDDALKGTPHFENWHQANRLWSKAYALRDVADTITRASKGTPAAAQAPGIAAVPTRLQGAQLVARLNTLADDGILDKAFSPSEIRNLRQSADLLDRIQRTPVGKGWGESMSISRGLRHAVSGARAPLFGAAVGGMVGGLRGAEIGAGIGLITQAIGERMLARVMTTTDGVTALKALAAARTPVEVQAAMRALTVTAAASSATQRPQPLRQLRDEADKRRPAAAAAY